MGRYMRVLEYSIQEFADDLGCGSRIVEYWVRGRYKPSKKYKDHVCELLGVYPEQLGF